MTYVFNTFTPATVIRLIDGSIARLKAGGITERKREQALRAARINELVQLRWVFENCVIEKTPKREKIHA